MPRDRLPETAPTPKPADVALGGRTTPAKYTPAEMQADIRNFADHYRQSLAAALDRVVIEANDPELIRRAQTAKINGATAMYDIAVNPVPATALLDTLVLVSLQTKFLRNHGERFFGEFYPLVQITADRLQEEAFRIAASAMTEQQRIDLRATISKWSEANPDVLEFWYVRLNDLPGIHENPDVLNTFTNLPRDFLNVFNPFASTGRSVTEAQVLAERMSWLGPRLMIVAQWRAEAIVYNSIANTRLHEALDLGERFAAIAEDLPATITQQREGLFHDLEANRSTLETLLDTTDRLAQSLTALIEAADPIAQTVVTIQETAYANAAPPDPNQPPGRPFDITEYTEALAELDELIVNANDLLMNADAAVSPDALEERIALLEDAARHLILTAAAAILIVGVLLTIAVKVIPRRPPDPNRQS